MNVIGTAGCLQSRGIPRSLIHTNKQPDNHRIGVAPVKEKPLLCLQQHIHHSLPRQKKGVRVIKMAWQILNLVFEEKG